MAVASSRASQQLNSGVSRTTCIASCSSDSMLSTRRWLKIGLTIGGALSGAAFGIVLTRLGKIVTDAPSATLGNYAWNAAVFGLIGGAVSPVVSFRRSDSSSDSRDSPDVTRRRLSLLASRQSECQSGI